MGAVVCLRTYNWKVIDLKMKRNCSTWKTSAMSWSIRRECILMQITAMMR